MKYKNKRIIASLILLVIGCFPVVSQAKTVVFIHGYMAEGSIWQNAGIIERMHQQGWSFAGRYGFDENFQVIRDIKKQRGNASVTIELPWHNSIAAQAELLNRYVQEIYRNRPEPIVLVGHSAGGVVARYGLVHYGRGNVESLITIASPHLGTPVAELAMLASDSPLGMLMQDLGDPTLRRSRGLFKDLMTARQGSFLGWLNQQPHPSVAYYSIVRVAAPVDLQRYDQADLVVPANFQDMNNVPALKGRSRHVASDGGHALVVKDADRVLRLLQE
jgi:triacylglycerol esterase/lipase EstA (alpha/beta hydrolase family)